jgi:eukaryotic-like serine/threonine-protein kinase
MFPSQEHTSTMSAMPTTNGDLPAEASLGTEPAPGSDSEMRSNDPPFPTLPEVSISPMSSDVRKAQVRAALFHKVEPVRVGRFILLERLGAGSMGEIYAAYDERLDRRVALKLVRHGSDLTVEADELLLREAQALAQVSHPNVVQIYEAGAHEGRLFIAMELIRGQTLTRWLEDAAQIPRPHRKREILRRFIAAGRGLEAAHAAGVAHRDFKPDNVLVGEDGRVCVVDFGLARVLVDDATLRSPPSTAERDAPKIIDPTFTHGETVRLDTTAPDAGRGASAGRSRSEDAAVDDAGARAMDRPGPAASASRHEPEEPAASCTPDEPLKLTAATRLTRTGTVMGTPRFMAPEQIRGGVPDQRSDQFSFCVALYHALYGTFPFTGSHPQELLDSIETGVTSLEHSAGLAARVRKALCRGLSVEPSERFASMGELLSALEPGLRRRGGWIAGAVLLFVAAAAAYLWLSPPGDPCATAGDGIDAAWSAERQSSAHAAFAHSDLPYAEVGWRTAKRRVDDYASRWRTEARAACRATQIDHVQSEQQLDRRMLCLERGRREVAALTSEFIAGAPDTIRHSVNAVESLFELDLCRHTENTMFGLEPPPPAIASDVNAVRDQLTHALIKERLGHMDEALVIAREARMVAERLNYRPVHAEALVQIARALDAKQTADARREAEGLYFDALDIAEAERHDQLAAEIWYRLAQLAARMDDGTLQAHMWWRRAEAAIGRIGNSAHDRANLHYLLGEIYCRDSKYAEAAEEQKRAIDAVTDVHEYQLDLSSYYQALAKTLEPQGRLDEAASLYERAARIDSDELGPSHPDVVEPRINYNIVLEKQGKLVAARAGLEAVLAAMPPSYQDASLDAGIVHTLLSDVSYYEGKLDDAIAHGHAALVIYERMGAPDYRRAEAYTNIANAELKRKNFAEALAVYQDVLSLRRRHLGDDHYQVGVTEGSIAEVLVELSRYDEAMAHIDEAERIFTHGSAHSLEIQAWILTVRGKALIGRHQPAAAVEVLERALPMFDGTPNSSNQAHAMWTLARALHDLGRDPVRVRQLAEKARALYATLGPSSAHNRDAVDQFIERLSPGPASPTPANRP